MAKLILETLFNTWNLNGGNFREFKLKGEHSTNNSDMDRLYCQWLNSVIYWLINHCWDWTWNGMTSFGPHFDFHDIIYRIQPCNVDDRRHNVIFT